MNSPPAAQGPGWLAGWPAGCGTAALLIPLRLKLVSRIRTKPYSADCAYFCSESRSVGNQSASRPALLSPAAEVFLQTRWLSDEPTRQKNTKPATPASSRDCDIVVTTKVPYSMFIQVPCLSIVCRILPWPQYYPNIFQGKSCVIHLESHQAMDNADSRIMPRETTFPSECLSLHVRDMLLSLPPRVLTLMMRSTVGFEAPTEVPFSP